MLGRICQMLVLFSCVCLALPPETWDVTKARGHTREIDLTTNEGTWMSVDISPDGQWVAFDLLGQIYRVRSQGGQAECLTQDSGVSRELSSTLLARREAHRVHLRP